MSHFVQTGIWMIAGTCSVRVPAPPPHPARRTSQGDQEKEMELAMQGAIWLGAGVTLVMLYRAGAGARCAP